jgi:hypothetical protein
MHLLGPQFTTLSTSKRRKKLSDSQYHKMAMELNDYNKQMKKYGLKPKTLDEYIAYRQGKYKPKLGGIIKEPMKATTFVRQAPKYESGIGVGVGFARKENVYTGTKIIGVAVLHKSCLQPVSSRQDAEDIAKMRRN